MTACKEWFAAFEPLAKGKIMIRFENGDLVSAQGIGQINTKSMVNGRLEKHTLHMLFISEITRNLFSIGAATGRGAEAEFTKDKLLIKINGKVRVVGKRIADHMYQMDIEVVVNAIEANFVTSEEKSLKLWHARLGHASIKTVREMAKNDTMIGMRCSNSVDSIQADYCEACIPDKQCRKSFPPSMTRAEKPGELIHFDICESMTIQSIGESIVMIVFIDDCSGTVFVKPMKSKAYIVDVMSR